ncbi:MAG: hypothetical protein IJR26_04100, partial [Bacteroidales bacterium]|nr:hypothetical protein [Bacteroidales bacterium]
MIKKLLTILAVLAMSGMAVAQTETLLTTITATGTEQASYSTVNVATVSFSYTVGGSSAYLANWGWWGYGWSATVNAAEGYTITKCVFYDDQDRTATDSEAPFVVETTEEDKTPKVNGTPILADTSKGITKIEVYGYATPAHTHDFTYSAEGDTITATCQNDGCDLTDNKVTLKIVPTTNLYANDGTSKEASLEGLEAYNAATGMNLSTSNIAYYKSGGSVSISRIQNGTIGTGTYEARIAYNGTDNFGNKVAKVSFTVTLKPTPHTHSFTYSASGNVITATCNGAGTCDLTNKQATLTL